MNLVDADRVWSKSRQGLPVTDLPRRLSACSLVIQADDALVIPDAAADPRFASNPLVTGATAFRFYAGYPLRDPAGHPIGTLCILDQHPHPFAASDVAALRDLAAVAEGELNAHNLSRALLDGRASEAQLRAVLDTMPDGVLAFDERGIIRDCNPAAQRLFGFAREAAIGQDIATLAAPEERRRLTSQFGTAATDDARREFIFQRHDGTIFPGDLVVGELRLDDRYLFTAVVRDISARQAAEATLRETEMHYRALVRHLPDTAVLLFDRDLRYLVAEGAALEQQGFTRERVEGRTLAEVLPPASAAALLPHYRAALNGTPTTLERIHGAATYLVRFAPVRNDVGMVVAGLVVSQDISARVQVEARLRESEALYRALVEYSTDAVLLTAPDGQVLGANPAACRLFGGTEAEICRVGRAGIVDGSDPRLAAFLAERERTGQARGELTHRRLDGSTFLGEVSSVLFRDRDGALRTTMTIRDLTDQRRAEEALARQAEVLQQQAQLLDLARDAITVRDFADGAIRFWNRGAEETFGWARGDAMGQPQHTLLRTQFLTGETNFPRPTQEVAAALLRTGSWAGEVIQTRRDGARIVVDSRWTLRSDERGKPTTILEISRDITAAKRAEAELAEAMLTQRAANEQLQGLSKAKGDFVSIVSHEFRTPLTVIQGFSEMMRDEAFSLDEMREYAGLIYHDAQRLNRLITDMLDLDRLESGRTELTRHPLDLNALVTEAVGTTRRLAVAHDFVLDLAPELPSVPGDPDKLAQVVINLVSNAVKYSPSGGTIVVGTRLEGGTAHLWVRDQGIGIAPEALEAIFERYARVESAATRNIQGTGLGLPIVRQIVELHGGRAWAESTRGQGSTFHVTLPLAR